MLTLDAAAQWLQMTPRELSEKSSGPDATIPAFRIGLRTIRYHPRTILAVLASRTKVGGELIPDRIIAASFGVEQAKEAA